MGSEILQKLSHGIRNFTEIEEILQKLSVLQQLCCWIHWNEWMDPIILKFRCHFKYQGTVYPMNIQD